MRRWTIGRWAVCAALLAGMVAPSFAQTKANLAAVDASIDRALAWFQTQKDKQGVWGAEIGPAMSGLVVTAYLRHPKGKYNADSPQIKAALDWMVSKQQPDGSIWDPKSQAPLPNYNTSLCLMALSSAKNPRYAAAAKKAQDYLMKLQFDEGEGATPEDSNYGGIGYGSTQGKYDLSNLNIALQALKESGVPADAAVWDKAVKFLNRIQNNSETNDQSWAGNDGGFVYAPGDPKKNIAPESKAGNDAQGRPRSYTTMTYAGLLSFIYANVAKTDERVQAAYKWLGSNWNLEENPPIGKQGLYYGYHTIAKALAAYGDPNFTKSDGTKLDWYQTLSTKLLSLQTKDGSFPPNDADRWMEGDPTLVTAYCVLALEAGYPKRANGTARR